MEPARISPGDLKKLIDSGKPVFIIDTRSPDSWNSSNVMIPNAVRIHFSELGDHLQEIPHDRTVVAYCT